MKRILVTGGAGFVGSNLIRELLSTEDHHVYCIDNLDEFYSKEQKELNIKDFFNDSRFHFIEDDIRNVNDHEELGEVEIIIHLAAKAGIRQSIQDPFIYQSVNIGGTLALLEFAKAKGIEQFVFASSSSVYGISQNIPWSESQQVLPISPYACSKYASEIYGFTYSHLYKIRFIALRFFTVYGPGQRPDLAIHKFFDCMLQERPIPVFGDGSSARDYTYVGDAVKAIIAATGYRSSNFEVINIGNSRTVNLNSLIGEIEQVCRSSAIIKYLPAQPGDVPVTFADIRKANSLLGYRPDTELASGLQNFYNWYKENRCLLNEYYPTSYL